MQITELLAQTGGLRSIARELGISESDTVNGAQALVPAILGGFKKQAQAQPTGLAGLGGLLGQLGGGGLMDDVLAPEPTNVNRGNDVLGRIFGSKDVSRAVAQNASSKTGLTAGLLKKMLPMLAMLVAGYLSRKGASAAGSGGGMGGELAGSRGGSSGGGLGGLLGGLLGGQGGRQDSRAAGAPPVGSGSGLGSMLDMDGDGNPLDDILRMAGKAFG